MMEEKAFDIQQIKAELESCPQLKELLDDLIQAFLTGNGSYMGLLGLPITWEQYCQYR